MVWAVKVTDVGGWIVLGPAVLDIVVVLSQVACWTT
jgi:hypothetical protein